MEGQTVKPEYHSNSHIREMGTDVLAPLIKTALMKGTVEGVYLRDIKVMQG